MEQSLMWESLERALHETEVLKAIYNNTGSFGDDERFGIDDSHAIPSSSFAFVSPSRLEIDRFKKLLGMETDDDPIDENSSHVSGKDDSSSTTRNINDVPVLTIEIRTHVEGEDGSESDHNLTANNSHNSRNQVTSIILRCVLPPRYPEMEPATVTSVQCQPRLTRSSTDQITRALNETSKSLLGTEAILDLVEETKRLVKSIVKSQQSEEQHSSPINNDRKDGDSSFGRRWIWVHHITNKDRISSILQEAGSHQLNGILKHGYPGVVLVEGNARHCDAFVKWIKGNKSSPHGGFGRNWGHHVRGEICGLSADERALDDHRGSERMRDTDDLATMAAYCLEAGLQDEFKAFVLQHH